MPSTGTPVTIGFKTYGWPWFRHPARPAVDFTPPLIRARRDRPWSLPDFGAPPQSRLITRHVQSSDTILKKATTSGLFLLKKLEDFAYEPGPPVRREKRLEISPPPTTSAAPKLTKTRKFAWFIHTRGGRGLECFRAPGPQARPTRDLTFRCHRLRQRKAVPHPLRFRDERPRDRRGWSFDSWLVFCAQRVSGRGRCHACSKDCLGDK